MLYLIKNRILTIGEVISELKNQFLDNGELNENDFSVYMAEESKLSIETVCCVADNIRVTDDNKRIYPTVPLESNMDLYISIEVIADVITTFLSRKRTASVDELITALEFYLNNDCFIEPEGELNDPNQNPNVILVKTPEDKMNTLLKIKRAFGLEKPMKELLILANNAPNILTDSLSFAEAKKIILKNGLEEWVAVKF